MTAIRLAAALAAALTASAAHAQAPVQAASVVAIAGLRSASVTDTVPARAEAGDAASSLETLRSRLGCGDERSRGRVAVGADVCAAIARYGQPSSVTFSDFGHTEMATMVWGSAGGSYGVHVSAFAYKDHPLTHQAGKQDEIGTWTIKRVFGQ